MTKEWYERNREKKLAYQKRYYQEHREERIRYQRAYDEQWKEQKDRYAEPRPTKKPTPPRIVHCGAWHEIHGLPWYCPTCQIQLFTKE